MRDAGPKDRNIPDHLDLSPRPYYGRIPDDYPKRGERRGNVVVGFAEVVLLYHLMTSSGKYSSMSSR